MKAISLLSGGLDSILATRLILDQGIDVEAVNFKTVFCTCTSRNSSCLASKSAADNLGIKLKVFEISKEYFEIVKEPKHGYGRNINPCLDCRIFIFKKAAEYMKKTSASFLITGEVLGERPMSQRKDALRIIERDSDLEGYIVRPLSAKLFKPSIPEEKGWVDRDKFLSIEGRSRKPQIKLAKDFGINDYPCPAGGCLLTDTGFANRMRDLMSHKPNFNVNDAKLLKVGRHFRPDKDIKFVVGRNEKENNILLSLAKEPDLCLYPGVVKGPVGIIRGRFNNELVLSCASIVARYCDNNSNKSTQIMFRKISKHVPESVIVVPQKDENLDKIRI